MVNWKVPELLMSSWSCWEAATTPKFRQASCFLSPCGVTLLTYLQLVHIRLVHDVAIMYTLMKTMQAESDSDNLAWSA